MRFASLVLFALAMASGTATSEPEYRVPMRQVDRPIHHGWFQLATPTPTTHGTEYISVEEGTWLRMLRIQRATGTVYVRQVRVMTYGRHARTKVINVNVRLDRWHPVTYIDLGYAVRVDQIAITTERRPYGSYVLYGSAALTRQDVASL
ncbi:MAG TPA: hypothetical protein VLT45_20275 [Kofleriaceae bacterium]|nr:hypothetical protein [Kofleriaceae bacterium]